MIYTRQDEHYASLDHFYNANHMIGTYEIW